MGLTLEIFDENEFGPETRTWFKGQADHARRVLDRIPGRAALLARIEALDSVGYSVSDVQYAGGRYFYFKTTPKDNNHKLYVRVGMRGAERVLVDPETVKGSAPHYSLDYFAPTLDGRYVAYALSPGGSEESVLSVCESATGRKLSEQIDRTRFGGVSWESASGLVQ